MKWSLVLCFGISLVLVSCASFQPTQPKGFAPFKSKTFASDFRAMSPEGITWRISAEEHKPKADLAFWKPALRKRMTEAGYRIVDSLSFEASGQKGWALELAAPLGQSDYSYLVAIIPCDKDLILVESSGTVADFAKRKSEILATLANIQAK